MTEEDAVVLREVGEPPEFDFEPRDHLEIGTELGLIDMEAAATALGLALRLPEGRPGDGRAGAGPLRDRAASAAEGHEPVVPPVLVREEALFGTGFFPGDRDQIYEIPQDELFLVGTSEVSLAGAARGPDPRAPARCRCATPASRPASAARRAPPASDTRGIFRVHQFDKVEMFSFVEPDASADEHERLLAIEERILAELEIPYRVVNVAVGDLGAPGGEEVRLRGLDPEPGPLPGADLLLEHDRLPGAPARLPLPARRGRGAPCTAHPERHRRRGRAHADRPDREPAGARRGIHATQFFASIRRP